MWTNFKLSTLLHISPNLIKLFSGALRLIIFFWCPVSIATNCRRCKTAGRSFDVKMSWWVKSPDVLTQYGRIACVIADAFGIILAALITPAASQRRKAKTIHSANTYLWTQPWTSRRARALNTTAINFCDWDKTPVYDQ